uniref:Prenyltransferase alpha-alpha toroid domain-containing protein n=1 Tax=Vannella robusta TaxID=1487602 RepID=A0A7S4MM02_9EUKA|mmetsp:Transcript_3173/g.3909  ORF Transcript_3173/g.3909 Transcript_3173/m.3909 type:complete len:953 (+) Transcript_3173:46-2904(+)
MKVIAALLCLTALAFLAQADFNDAVQQLARFQDLQTGAFQTNFNSAPTLEATTDALFLSSLYGLKSKINSFKAEEYLQSLRTKENGYSSSAGGVATLEATFNAVVSYVHLGEEVPQSSAVVDFVLSLVDASNMFSNNAGGRGNIKSTYQAIATLRALDSIESLPSSVSTSLINTLSAANNGKYFDFTNVPAIKSNFYGVYIWETLNEDVLEGEENVNFILSQQSASGGFFADAQQTTVSYESSALALATLSIIGDYSSVSPTSRVNAAALAGYCKNVPVDLSETAFAHKAVAHTSVFSDNFKFVVEYGGADTRGNLVLQGTQLRPEIVVRSFNGPSHSNLVVNVKYTAPGEQPRSVRMAWDDDNQKYVAPQGIDTSNKLGKIEFEYDMNLLVFGIGSTRFVQKAEKNIGHRVSVIPTATHRITGASIKEGEVVSANTDFEFDVKLANKTHSSIKSGNFALAFTVMDSSYATIHRESVDAATNTEAFQFSYSLEKLDVPAGEFSFLFAVTGDDGKHFANEIVVYTVSVPMIASDVQLNNQEFTLGSDFSASIVAATYPELREVLPLVEPSVPSSYTRNFFLDISSSSGVVIHSLLGQFSNGRYHFETNIPASYGSLGSFVISFRYETAKGEQFELDNFANGEISEEALTFSVNAKLVAEVLSKPESTKFFYGNDIAYQFRVVDELTGSPVSLGQSGGVFLNLNHFDSAKGKSFVSTKLPATQEGDDLVINWKVNPNAASGKGSLVLVAEGPGGDEVPLLVNGKQFTTDIDIGGEIKEDVQMFSTDDFYSSQTAFIVQFELSCNDVLLRDVKLRAVILYEGEEIGSAPVGVSGDKYLASWNKLHIEAESGTYTVLFYREADQQRAADNEEWRQKQLRDKQREAELTGEAFDEAKFLASLDSVQVEPLFSVTIPHRQVSRGGLPFGTEWLIFIPTLIGFFFFDRIKGQYRKGIRK